MTCTVFPAILLEIDSTSQAELITGLELPPLPFARCSAYRRLATRRLRVALVSLAAVVEPRTA